MIAVINYGAGNLPNVVRALYNVGADLQVTDDPDVVVAAPAVVLPGVGATRDTMASLDRMGMSEALRTTVAAGKPFLGICVGMQVLFRISEEFGEHACLGLLDGRVQRLPGGAPGERLPVPQIGWNQVHFTPTAAGHPLFAGIPDGSDFYFVHSYYCAVSNPAIIAGETEYGLRFPSIVVTGNLAAVQFHPEKSGRRGQQLLHNFVGWCSGEAPSILQNAATAATGL